MADLISREDAIRAMLRLECEDIDAYGAKIPEGFDAEPAVEALKALPSAQQWIPATERLPEEKYNPNTADFECVLCTTTWGDVRAFGFGKPIGWAEPHFWHGASAMDKYVIAWMPLPEPYREEEDDGRPD